MKYIYTATLLCIVSILSGCAKPEAPTGPISKSGFYFDTVIEITLYDSGDETLLDECFSYCEQFEKQISRTLEDSDVSRINASGGKPVKVSDTTIDLLKLGIRYGELSGGVFDITIAPLSILWDVKNNPGIVPAADEIAEALSHVNYNNILIEGNTVTLSDPKAAIDLGGIAKGHVADYLKTYLQKKGVKSALINLGGNILTIGEKPDGTEFRIGIKKPFDESGTPITAISVKDSSVVTSGSYERYFKIDDIIYHHILSTKDGYPCNTDLLSVTILSEKSADGDALSTSCFALGLEEGLAFIRSLDGIEAIFITDSYEIYDSRDIL